MKPVLPLLALGAFVCRPAGAAEERNILSIVSDDQSYVGVGFHGSKQAVTPHLAALAKSGVRCTSGCVPYPVCSPSRAGLLTGRHQSRFEHKNNPAYDPIEANEGLPLAELGPRANCQALEFCAGRSE